MNVDAFGSQGLRQIVYREGLARFNIPAHWHAEIDPTTGGEFYDPGGTATLRLTVLTFRAPAGTAAEPRMPLRADQRMLETGRLPNGCVLQVSEQDSVEDDEPLRLRSWRILQVRGHYSHVYAFVYSYDPPFEDAAAALELIDREVRRMIPCTGKLDTQQCVCTRGIED